MVLRNLSMGDDHDCQAPPWMNSSFIAVALKQEYGGKHVRVTGMTVEDANPSRTGLMSRLYRVAATVEVAGEAGPRVSHLVVKCSMGTGVVEELGRLQRVFARESLVLTSVLPEVHEALGQPIGPRCLLATCSPVDVLVMEDLSAAGFRLPPDGFLDLDHCRLVMDRLARWHAASCALGLTRPDSGADPLLKYDPMWEPRVVSLVEPFHRLQYRSIGVALSHFPDCSKYSEKYKDSGGWADKVMHAVKLSCAQSDFKVLAHADVWSKNILFKYQDGKPTDLRFVDFQFSHLASPARDLVQFLYGNASEQVHRGHMEALLAQYHGALQRSLQSLGLQASADRYPLQRLLADVDGLAALALHAACYSPILTATDRRRLDIIAGMGVTGEYSQPLVDIYTDPALISYWRCLNPILESKGVL